MRAWNSCVTTPWKRSMTRGLGGGGPWPQMTEGGWRREVMGLDCGVQRRLLLLLEADADDGDDADDGARALLLLWWWWWCSSDGWGGERACGCGCDPAGASVGSVVRARRRSSKPHARRLGVGEERHKKRTPPPPSPQPWPQRPRLPGDHARRDDRLAPARHGRAGRPGRAERGHLFSVALTRCSSAFCLPLSLSLRARLSLSLSVLSLLDVKHVSV